jgi:hypothetical protein
MSTAAQTVLYSPGNVFEIAVAVAAADANVTDDPAVLPPAETIVVFAETVADIDVESLRAAGFKTIRGVVYGADYAHAVDDGFITFPPDEIFTNIALTRGVEVASFLDHVGIKSVPGWRKCIGDTSIARADLIFRAIAGMRLSYPAVCMSVIDGDRTVAELINDGKIVDSVQNAAMFRALQAGVVTVTLIPRCPGADDRVYPDGSAPDLYRTKILAVNYVPELLRKGYLEAFFANGDIDYVVMRALERGAGVETDSITDARAVIKYICVRVRAGAGGIAVPSPLCVLGGGDLTGEIATSTSDHIKKYVPFI